MMRLQMLEPRADTNPCPGGNGTTLGTFQQFTLACNSNVAGDTINSTDADSFLQCVDTCSSFHPRCEGVSFNKRRCELKANVKSSDPTDRSRRFDAAIAQFPSASSNCGTLGSATTSGSMNFNVFCGNVINGNDLSQAFTETFQDCMSMCTSTGGCGGVSFDASLKSGFKNCYLKGPASGSSPIVDQGIDSAVVNNAAAAPPVPVSSNSSQSPAPDPTPTAQSTPATTFATTASPQTVTATATVVSSADPVTVTAAPATTSAVAASSVAPIPASTTGGSFVTLSTPPATDSATVSTQTVVSVVTSFDGSSATMVPTTLLQTIPFSDSPYSMASTALDSGATAVASVEAPQTSTANAWIAAPVVGSIAAVSVVAVAFVIWGRRRTRRSGGTSPTFLNRLPFMHSRSDLGSPTGKPPSRGLPFGNYWRLGHKMNDEESTRGVSRGGLASRGNTAITRENTPQYEVREGKVSLRDSLNGLAQHRSTLDGIPGFLRE